MASEAPNTPHRASYPNEAMSPSTRPSPRTVSIGEFSTSTRRGRTSPTTRAISRQRPLFSPSIPVPAEFDADMSWHGNPPHTQSTSPRHGLPLNVRTSSQIGNFGKIPSRCRWSSTFRQYGSISTAQTQVCPRRIPPRIPPPAPANRCSSFSLGLHSRPTPPACRAATPPHRRPATP